MGETIRYAHDTSHILNEGKLEWEKENTELQKEIESVKNDWDRDNKIVIEQEILIRKLEKKLSQKDHEWTQKILNVFKEYFKTVDNADYYICRCGCNQKIPIDNCLANKLRKDILDVLNIKED